MPRLPNSRLFLDVNVWVALSARGHEHFESANQWLATLPEGCRLVFCRVTQLALLRLLTTKSVMEDEALTQAQAWKVYRAWMSDDRVEFAEEPYGLEPVLFRRTQGNYARPNEWTDHYLAAFAQAAGLTLVTHDKKLAASVAGSVLLPGEI